MIYDSWTPKFKWQLINWFKQQYPTWKVSQWSKKKLYAVFFQERSKRSEQ